MNIVHFADAHIGVTTHGKIDAATGLNDRVVDFLDAFDYIIDYVEEAGIDLALFAGDLFHHNNPSPALISEAAVRIKELSGLCPLVMVPGNHDQAMNRVSAVDVFAALETENVYVSDSPKNYFIETKHGEVFIGALPYPTFSMFGIQGRNDEAKLELVEAVDECIWDWLDVNSSGRVPGILLAHGTVSGASYGNYKGMALGYDVNIIRERIQSGWDYVALGHIHMFQDLTKHLRNACPIVYSGSIERVDFGEAAEAKGFVHVNITQGQTTYKFIEIPARPLQTIRIDAKAALFDPDAYVVKTLSRMKIHPDSIVKVVIDAQDVLDIDVQRVYKELDEVYRVAQVQVNVERQNTQRIELDEGETISDLTHEELLEEYLIQQDTPDDEIDEVMDLWDDLMEDL